MRNLFTNLQLSEPTATISGFVVIPVSYDSPTTYYMYAQPHSSSKGKRNTNQTTLPDGRTLFLVNVPSDATKRELVLFFSNLQGLSRRLFLEMRLKLRMKKQQQTTPMRKIMMGRISLWKTQMGCKATSKNPQPVKVEKATSRHA